MRDVVTTASSLCGYHKVYANVMVALAPISSGMMRLRSIATLIDGQCVAYTGADSAGRRQIDTHNVITAKPVSRTRMIASSKPRRLRFFVVLKMWENQAGTRVAPSLQSGPYWLLL
jgi:hypothetical protein